MITPQKIRNLPISAASGLVIAGDYFYVIADDEIHLSVLSLRDENFHQRIKLFVGELPAEKKVRKKLKPDLEALLQLSATAEHPNGALLALGSGSKSTGSIANRQRGVIIPFNPEGALSEKITTLDLSTLYASLPFADLNIEGAFVKDDQLVLMQRGNNTYPQSALIYVCVSPCKVGGVPRSGEGVTITEYTLPTIAGVPLCFTDGLYLPNGDILFSAVAENTADSYNDGVCVGAAIGRINAQGELISCEMLSQPYKVEGIAIAPGEPDILYMVTDADDRAKPAVLYRASVAPPAK